MKATLPSSCSRPAAANNGARLRRGRTESLHQRCIAERTCASGENSSRRQPLGEAIRDRTIATKAVHMPAAALVFLVSAAGDNEQNPALTRVAAISGERRELRCEGVLRWCR